ncbi:uncharacterized protein LOC105772019 [Gossypium raimondii]|uniref:uncharacterized protein LOC105772019 n=1 Tax=Gossypium raimondii TaxID=29730 RepID=UPI00063A8857|nr:uncharacterized protein LOC105772019 [Gossypium raimondii]
MLRRCVLEFTRRWECYLPLTKFTYNNNYQASIQMAPFEALYGRRCRTPMYWSKLDEKRIVGLELVHKTGDKVKMICERLKATLDRQNSYANLKRQDVEYQVGKYVFLKVSPWKKVLRFGCKGKLSPRSIGLYEMVDIIGLIAYQLKLPCELDRIHDVFHVSMLRKYLADPSHVLSADGIEVRPDLTFEEEPMKIVAHEVKVLRRKRTIWSKCCDETIRPMKLLGK